MHTRDLFKLEDKFLKLPGLYLMWSLLYWSNIIVLCIDDTIGNMRNFNLAISLISTIYCGFSSANNILGNKLPSTLLLTEGPIHQYSYWLLFTYFGTSVLGTNPLGVMNWIHTIVVGIFTVDMVFKTWYTSFNIDSYLRYVEENKPKNNLNTFRTRSRRASIVELGSEKN